ncbi:amino acid transporter LysE [Alcanivorax hongdengensis A-11-3]|uniref:Amino acid transporter LysE n=1 Tax=Alcanivorax hongdengensis A-11-3 TaxID=1177179 RepID=L0WF81_9GAMM|nr:LysE family translocator [Alcanivorax hongdengensis]EKF75493.1 amino acid transporter LysE [Alcanivorax hongdengensis A-11-3]
MALHEWLLLASICALGAMTPGVSLAVITRHTLHGGANAGAVAGVTHALGIGLWALATVTGLALLLHRYPQLDLLLSLAGAVFLLWMAAKSWQAGRAGTPVPQPQPRALHSAARDGFMIAFLNPKVALFFLALFSQFLHRDMGNLARGQMVLTSMVIDGGWYVLVALMLGRSRLLPWLREHHHWVERATAVLLLVIAVSVMIRALSLTWG